MRDASRIINAPMPGCQEGGGDTLLPAVEADPPDTVLWGVYLGDIHAAGTLPHWPCWLTREVSIILLAASTHPCKPG